MRVLLILLLPSLMVIAQLGVSHENTGSGVDIGDPVTADDDDDSVILGGSDAGYSLGTSAALDAILYGSFQLMMGEGGISISNDQCY